MVVMWLIQLRIGAGGARTTGRVKGAHDERTAAWPANLDAHRDQAIDRVGSTGALNERRAFFAACAELFGYPGGRQWIVSRTLLEPR